jgi:thioester reductase-like protein
MVKRRRLARLETVTLRVGQIAGSQTHGTWSTQDWVPIIIKSGVALGSLPYTDGVSTTFQVNYSRLIDTLER